MALHVGYEPAKSCSSGPTPGAKALMSWYLGAYGSRGGRNGGIYNCRSIAGSKTTSLHGEGRADDLMVPVGASWAQPLADKLVANSKELGIQLVIYNRHVWSGSYPNAGWRDYDGENPHRDHLHVELSRAAARTLTAGKVQAEIGGGSGGGTTKPTWTKELIMDLPTLRRGAKGASVGVLQGLCNARGQKLSIDNDFGPKTEAAVRAEQSQGRIAVDGVAGRHTYSVLLLGRDIF
ncbi:peptidoglycan-binding domain-containing protein [Plantactinospora sp. CA-294935]|uniref:peptidoglycan-binding domain-containing protein n=1 Tax=Plantactinospora sp. CA-294935 TaxID=3240012 RepID=UPI003D90D2EC